MNVVTARVHHADFHARVVLRFDRACVGNARFLFNRQRVELGTHEHRWSRSILQNSDEAVAGPLRILKLPDAFRDREPKLTQLTGDEGCRLLLAMRELGCGVERFVSGHERCDFTIDQRIERGLLSVAVD